MAERHEGSMLRCVYTYDSRELRNRYLISSQDSLLTSLRGCPLCMAEPPPCPRTLASQAHMPKSAPGQLQKHTDQELFFHLLLCLPSAHGLFISFQTQLLQHVLFHWKNLYKEPNLVPARKTFTTA